MMPQFPGIIQQKNEESLMKTRKAIFMSIALAAVMLMTIGASVQAAEKPDWFFHDIVDTAIVKQHVKVPMAEDVMVIDARPKRAKYDKGHIPMAVSIPDSKFGKMIDKLPKEKNALLIFYCGGST